MQAADQQISCFRQRRWQVFNAAIVRYCLRMNETEPDMQESRAWQAGHTDIAPAGWWRHLPKWTHPYLILARFDRPIGWWLLLLPGWWIIAATSPDSSAMLTLMLLFLVGAVTTRAAGCVINDLWDRNLDRRVVRTAGRPLASGAVSLIQALVFLGLLGGIGLLVLAQLPLIAIVTGVASLPLVILYPLAKRVTWWPQAVLGLTFSWGVPLGWTAATGALPTAETMPAALILYAASVCWVFGYDTIYAVQDMADDRLAAVKSSALGLGRHLHLGVGIAYALAGLGLMAGFMMLLGAGIWLVGLAAAMLHFIWQIRRLDADNAPLALILFKSNRDAGLLITVGLVLHRFIT